MSQCLLQKLQQSAPRFDFAVVNECSGFDSQCLGEIRIGLYSCSYGLHNVSTRCSVKLPIVRIFQFTALDVLAQIRWGFQVVPNVFASRLAPTKGRADSVGKGGEDFSD